MPTGPVDAGVRKIKAELKTIIGKYPSSTADPHNTLFDFEADEEKLKVFDRKIQMICNSVEPFTITCIDFGEFYWNKTIYVALDEKTLKLITQLRKKLSAQLKHGKYDEEVNFDAGKSPHITVARTLQEEQYQTAKKYFHNKKFSGSFLCEGIALRKLIEGKGFTKYGVIKIYPFSKQNLTLF
ncbi:MAG: 2'-5' RNA ligase family protein [Fimbriimonadaceae bacterium]|nr:2'-5' RNA ligase family protein [Chitinophagales bacterium]